MTATSFSRSGSFVTLLIWAGCTTVICLVDEKLSLQPATTIGYHSTEMTTANAIYGERTLPFDCGTNSVKCMDYCGLCLQYFGGPNKDCLSGLLTFQCLAIYEKEMNSLNSTDWCVWSRVSGLYSNLSHCTEEISDCLRIPWPNSLVEETFVKIHSEFFKDCPTEELSDPPPVIVFALVITPICLIPVMVSLVVLKTKNGDGSS